MVRRSALGQYWPATIIIHLVAVHILPALAADPFNTADALPPIVPSAVLGRPTECQPFALGDPLGLPEAIERALCSNPKTREAWANVKLQAASVGVAEAAFLPTVTGSAQDVRDRSSTDVLGQRYLDTAQTGQQRSAYLSLNWILFDFGARRSALNSAVALLGAAQANHQATLQATFVTVAKDYYAAQAALSTYRVSLDVERTANQSVDAATQRMSLGVVSISDRLQAQTAAAQATVNRVRAHGDWQIALGVLANDMAVEPDVPLHVPDIDDEAAELTVFNESVAELISEARRSHLTVLAAKRQLEAAEFKAQQARREGYPSLSIVGRSSRSKERISPGFGATPVPSLARDAYVGLQLSIPVFEGFLRSYEVRQAESQADVQRIVVAETEQKVGLDVWTSYQNLQATSENVGNSGALLGIAQRGYSAARVRYEAGAGSIIELLGAQTSLANAQRVRVQSLSDWRTARLQLAGALGRLNTWSAVFER